MSVFDGFPGQRFRVLPTPLAVAALQDPVTGRLLVTDAGYFPRARGHGLSRPQGAPAAIVMICQDGAGKLWLDGTTYRVTAGDGVVIPPSTPHRYQSDERQPWTIWWFHATGRDIHGLVAAALGPESTPVAPLRDAYAARNLVDRVVSALERDETAASLYAAAGAAWNLLAQLASERQLGLAGTVERVGLAQDYLRDNFATAPSVSELARTAGLSTSHFSAVFRKSTGMGVLEYVKRLRNARARELLAATDLAVAEVGRQVGYTDPFYFSRQFHSVNGTSPSEFRQSYRRESTSVNGRLHPAALSRRAP